MLVQGWQMQRDAVHRELNATTVTRGSEVRVSVTGEPIDDGEAAEPIVSKIKENV
jgi:hypothetical protein